MAGSYTFHLHYHCLDHSFCIEALALYIYTSLRLPSFSFYSHLGSMDS